MLPSTATRSRSVSLHQLVVAYARSVPDSAQDGTVVRDRVLPAHDRKHQRTVAPFATSVPRFAKHLHSEMKGHKKPLLVHHIVKARARFPLNSIHILSTLPNCADCMLFSSSGIDFGQRKPLNGACLSRSRIRMAMALTAIPRVRMRRPRTGSRAHLPVVQVRVQPGPPSRWHRA